MVAGVVVVFLLLLAQLTYAAENDTNSEDPVPALEKSGTKRHFQDLSYLGRGYNMLTGHPGSANDYGVEAAVFQIGYIDNNENSVPIGVDAIRTPSCDMMFKSHGIIDISNYTQELKLAVSGNLSIVAAPFSANAEFTDLAQTVSNSSSLFVENVAYCEQYRASLNQYNHKALMTLNYKNAVNTLPTVYNSNDPECVEAFKSFFNEFGTHVVVHVTMGAKLILRHEMNEVKFRDLKGKGVKVNLAASIWSMLQFDPVPAEFPFITSEQAEQQAQLFGEKRTSTVLISKGANVPHDANLDDWLKEASNNPALLEFRLEPIYNFLPDSLTRAVVAATRDFCRHVPDARCELPLTEPRKLYPLCPRVQYSGNWTSRRPCFDGDKPAPPDPGVELSCHGGKTMAMAGLRFSHKRLGIKNSWTGLVDIGCTNIVDTKMELNQPQWSKPLRKTRSSKETEPELETEPVQEVELEQETELERNTEPKRKIECPKGQLVTGIRFSHKCSYFNSLKNEYVSLQCSRASSTIGQCVFTDWESAATLPTWTETSCPLGTILKGVHFRFKKRREQYRLKCCEAGKKQCTDVVHDDE